MKRWIKEERKCGNKIRAKSSHLFSRRSLSVESWKEHENHIKKSVKFMDEVENMSPIKIHK